MEQSITQALRDRRLTRLGAGFLLAGLGTVALGLVAVRPTLAIYMGAGALVGSLVGWVGLGSPALPRPALDLSGLRRRFRHADLAVTILMMLLAIGTSALAVSQAFHPQVPRPDGAITSSVPVSTAVPYEARLSFQNERNEWDIHEFIRLPGKPMLDPQWQLVDRRGHDGEVGLYERTRLEAAGADSWPPVQTERLVIPPTYLPHRELIPAAGSRIQLVAPEGFLREVDAATYTRDFDGHEIVTLHLPDRLAGPENAITVRVANGIGRWSVYAALEAATAWEMVKWAFAFICALIAGGVVTVLFSRRAQRKRSTKGIHRAPMPVPGRISVHLPPEALDAALSIGSAGSEAVHYRWDPYDRSWRASEQNER